MASLDGLELDGHDLGALIDCVFGQLVLRDALPIECNVLNGIGVWIACREHGRLLDHDAETPSANDRQRRECLIPRYDMHQRVCVVSQLITCVGCEILLESH